MKILDKKIIKYNKDILNLIQKEYNFNPNLGIEQIKSRPELKLIYTIFKNTISFIYSNDLDIKIPYDSLGLKTKQKTKIIKPLSIYFCKVTTDSSIWKIGKSIRV